VHAAASVLSLGFLLGLRHATDADHVLAVSTIVARERRQMAVGRGRPFAVGVVHGLAGSAAVALLVLSTIGYSPLAVAYLVIFAVGTLAGMALLTTAVALPFAFAAGRFERVNRSLTQLTGLASLLFGVFIAYELVLVHGLSSAAPTWTPG
jgi:high-affinity nickel permease